MPVVGAKPRIKYRGVIRNDMNKVRLYCGYLLGQNQNSAHPNFLTPAQVTTVQTCEALMVTLLAEKTA